MRCDREKNNSLHSIWLLTKQERMPAVNEHRLSSFIIGAALCLHQALQKMPRSKDVPHAVSSNVTLLNLKGLLGFEPLVPYQSTVVFAILVGQVCNGGCNAGTEELLPLVKVTLMDFIQELVVSVNINNGYEFILAGENCTTTNLKAVSLF